METLSKAISVSRIERVFDWMLARYGSRFTAQFEMVDPAKLKQTWESELAEFSDRELRRGLEACRSLDWPPTLPGFRNLCRPKLDYEAAFIEAANKWPAREGWTDSAIWWAATSIGNEVRTTPYRYIENRWKSALDRFMQSPLPIPKEPEQRLSAPVAPKESTDEARQRCMETARNLGLVR